MHHSIAARGARESWRAEREVTVTNGRKADEKRARREPVRAAFLYNADAGALAAMLDSARKLARSRNACALCAVTHGMAGKRKAWSEMECALGFPSVYYHRNEIPEEIGKFLRANGLRLPAVLFEMDGGGYETAVTAEQIGECRGDPRRLGARIEAARERLTPH
jgi:hypothetical protein